jgi:long-subunit fatty acid transport protein
MLQGGLGFERGPVADASRTPRLPGLNLILFGCGATYAVTRDLRLQAAYLHEFGLAGAANSFSATPSAGVLTGSYRTQADVISVGMAWQF